MPRQRCALFVPCALLLLFPSPATPAQSQSAQPPANYRGPDTYGMCAYVAGDTSYYGNTFQISSYFKPQAQQAIQQYAQTHANGATVKGARCYWSYKESDLATTKETDKRLLGLPGHSVKGVETGWTFKPATSAAASATTRTAPNSVNSRYGNAATTTTPASYTAAGTNAVSNTGTTSSSGTMSSMTGGAQQQLSDARTGAIGSATAGVTSITTSAVGGATSAMQGLGSRMFHGKSSQAPTQTTTATGAAPAATGAAAPPANRLAPSEPASAAAPQEVASNAPGLGLGVAPDVPGAGMGGAPASTQVPLEGLVADVAGKDLIINIGQGAGVAAGMRMVVMHPQRVVKDPVTGKVLRSVESQVGELKVTGADAASASGTFTGTGIPVVGDKVRLAPK